MKWTNRTRGWVVSPNTILFSCKGKSGNLDTIFLKGGRPPRMHAKVAFSKQRRFFFSPAVKREEKWIFFFFSPFFLYQTSNSKVVVVGVEGAIPPKREYHLRAGGGSPSSSDPSFFFRPSLPPSVPPLFTQAQFFSFSGRRAPISPSYTRVRKSPMNHVFTSYNFPLYASAAKWDST